MRNRLIQQFEFPKQTVLNRHIPKTSFFQNADLTKSEQDLFTSQIDGIYLLSIMNQDSMNIPEYRTEDRRYEVINWLYVKLRTSEHTNRIVIAIHKAIPNPLVLIIGLPGDQLLLSTANKRLNKVDETKTVIEEPVWTNWFELDKLNDEYSHLLRALMAINLSTENLFELYQDIHDWLQCELAIKLVGRIPMKRGNRDGVIELLNEMKTYLTKITELKKSEKGNLNFGDKMKMHMNRKKIEQIIENKIVKIRELC